MDFAPYQDQEPSIERAKSPPPQSNVRSPIRSPQPRSPPARAVNDPFLPPPFTDDEQQEPLPAPSAFGNSAYDAELGRTNIDLFETSLPMRMDHEAMLAYLLLPPAGGVFLLMTEHKSDYVRFHAWQSSLLFSAVFLLHLLFSFQAWLSYLLLVLDLIAIAFLTMRAYKDADTLDRFEVPFFGRLASSFVDDE